MLNVKNVNIKKTKEQFISEATLIHGDRFSYENIIYISNKKNIEIICKIHGLFLQTPKSHLKGSICKRCSLITKKYYNRVEEEEFLKKANLKHNNKYNYDKVKFINLNTKIIIFCPDHGEYETTPISHLKHGCKKCYYKIIGKTLKKNTNTFINQASKKHNNYYDYSLVEYKGNHKKVTIICPKHGKFNQNPSSHLIGSGCPSCRMSKGESSVESFLIENSINYIKQHTFNDCRNKNVLPFDFFLTDYNICVEYDGKQHFVNNDRRSFYFKNDTKSNDIIKNNYCLNNNINLIRICYRDFNKIEKILYDKMKQYKKITQEEKNNKFISKAREIFGYRYDYSKINYIDAHTHVTIIYNKKEYKQTPIKHLKGKKVENTIKKITTEEFIEKSKSIWGPDRFDYSKCEYLGTNDNILIFDKNKNKWIKQAAKSHLKGFEVAKHSKFEFINMCELIYDYKYNYTHIEYNSLLSRIKIICTEHGEFELKSSSHLLGFSHCTHCKDFVGEKEISKFLNKNNINYDRQHKFIDCRNIHPLPFDFYIPSIRACVEFDGLQHFQPIDHFGGLPTYETLKINDKIKEDYCEENYINLIRIRYDQIDQITKILKENLSLILK